MLDSFTEVSVTRYSLSSSVLSGAIVEIEHHHFLRQIEYKTLRAQGERERVSRAEQQILVQYSGAP